MPGKSLVKVKHGVFQGILARFYSLKEPFTDDIERSALAEKVLPSINHVWIGKPHDRVEKNYIVEFKGFLKVQESGSYRFFVVANNGIKLWLNEKLLLESWRDSPTRRLDTSSISLEEGYYRIRLLHYCKVGFSEVRLGWVKPNGKEEYIPGENMCFSTGEHVFVLLPDKYVVRVAPLRDDVREKLCISLNNTCVVEVPYGEQPLIALLSIYDEKGQIVFRTTEPVELWGGDVLEYRTS
ncbi:MAG: PA14 domain-containing protein [Desulfurococcaceae archaeon]